MIFKEKIKYLRKTKGLSQEELANELKISRQAISRWETGENMPDAEMLVQLSLIFDVSVDSLLKDEMDILCKNQSPVSKQNSTDILVCKISGICITAVSGISLICLGILSSLFPVYGKHYINSGNDILYKANIFTFLSEHNLEWLFIIIVFALILGAILISNKRVRSLKSKFNKSKEKDVSKK